MIYKNFYQTIENNLKDNHFQNIVEEGIKYNFDTLYKMVNDKYKLIKKEQLSQNIIVHMESTIECLSLVLALWKANKTYIPINITTPQKRLELIKDSLRNYSELKISEDNKIEILSDKKGDPISQNNFVAYIIFTSGTTGNPKGVKITHSNLCSLFSKLGEKFNFSNEDTWINLHSLEFDFSIWEIFAPLYYCNNLVLLGKSTKIFEFDRIADLLKEQQVNVLNQTPSAFFTLSHFLDESNLRSINKVIFGGEKLEYSELSKVYFDYHSKGIEFYNLYGITEITIHATFHLISNEDFESKRNISNVGKGLFGDNVFLEKNSDYDYPEIVVSGPTVSEGYINNKKENLKRFKNGLKGRLYYSGDLGEYLPNGDINYIGRADNQIELNGYRVELSEVKQALYSLNNDFDNLFLIKYKEKLVCFYIMSSGKNLNLNSIKKELSTIIPNYMIPSYFIAVKEIPLTINGKIDIHFLEQILEKKLLSEEFNSINGLTTFENWLVKNYHVNCRDFENTSFTELGLTSIELISLHEEASKQFEFKKEISIVDFFQFNSIKEFEKEFIK